MGQQLLSAFFLGLKESLNPYALVTILIFCLFLSFVGMGRRQMAVSGISFVLSVLVTTFLLLLGVLDRWIYQPMVVRTIRQIYLAIGVLWIGLGSVIFLSWWRYKKDNDLNRFLRSFPRFLSETGHHRLIPETGRIFFSIVLGGMFALLSSIWPQDRDLYLVSYAFMTAGHPGLALAAFFVYSLAFVIPLLIIWRLWMRMESSQGYPWFVQSAGYIKLVFSAVFIAVGIAEVYLFLNQ